MTWRIREFHLFKSFTLLRKGEYPIKEVKETKSDKVTVLSPSQMMDAETLMECLNNKLSNIQ